MNVSPLEPGRYVIAVSGGVDSMCLLHRLSAVDGLELVVVHFDHAQRPDSRLDAKLVESTARRLGLRYYGGQAEASQRPDENSLRQARYAFLREVKHSFDAQAILTAHHQDDLLETIILKLLRGTNRKGLSPMQASADIIRPLLGVTKQAIYDYATAHKLIWQDDSSNASLAYKRNYIRSIIMPKLTKRQRTKLLQICQTMAPLNQAIDDILSERIKPEFDRMSFAGWPHAVSREYLADWLRHYQVGDFTEQTLERLTVAAKTLPPGKSVDVMNGVKLRINSQSLALVAGERYNKETYG